jgi:hypothetical protein
LLLLKVLLAGHSHRAYGSADFYKHKVKLLSLLCSLGTTGKKETHTGTVRFPFLPVGMLQLEKCLMDCDKT